MYQVIHIQKLTHNNLLEPMDTTTHINLNNQPICLFHLAHLPTLRYLWFRKSFFLASHVREQPYRPVVLGEASQWFVVLSAQFVAASIWYIMLEFLNLSPVSLARPCAIKTVQNSKYLVSLFLVLCLNKRNVMLDILWYVWTCSPSPHVFEIFLAQVYATFEGWPAEFCLIWS